MSIVEELRSKASRDNRELLDRAAAEIEDLERNLAGACKKVKNQSKEILWLHNHIRSLERSRDNWRDKAKRVGKQLHEELQEGEWVNKSEDRFEFYEYTYECSLCGYYMIICDEDNVNFCPSCGARMKGGAE